MLSLWSLSPFVSPVLCFPVVIFSSPDKAHNRDPPLTQTHVRAVVETQAVLATATVQGGGRTPFAIEGAPPTSTDGVQIYFLPPNNPADLIPSLNSTLPTRPNSAQDAPAPPAVAPSPSPSSNSAPNDTSGAPSDGDTQPPPAQVPLVMAYYPSWVADTFPPEKIDFGRFDWIDFAFAVPGEKFGLSWDGSDQAQSLLARLVSVAHAKGKKVKLSVGGWTGSKWFSPAVSSDTNRQTFVNNILSAYNQFNLDGIDIDWEYPGQEGAPGNRVSPDDSDNFLAFLQLLRTTLPQGARITAATQTQPFASAQGSPMANVTEFVQALDWILMMNYDVWQASSNPGPNAPLSDACQNSTQPNSNADMAIRTWTAAGFPAEKLVLGVPSYGYVSKSTATQLRTRQQPANDTDSTNNGTGTSAPQDAVHVKSEDEGQVQFRDLVVQGALCPSASVPSSSSSTANATRQEHAREQAPDATGEPGDYDACGGFVRAWDACSNTPWLRSESAGQVISYDDARSLQMKAEMVRTHGLLGVNMFDVHGDTDEWALVDSLRKGLGL